MGSKEGVGVNHWRKWWNWSQRGQTSCKGRDSSGNPGHFASQFFRKYEGVLSTCYILACPRLEGNNVTYFKCDLSDTEEIKRGGLGYGKKRAVLVI